ncbi:MAG: hypothetical protein V4539_06420 [Bacteroidota bacterium]
MSKTSLSHPGAKKAILTAWLVAGTLDILAACTQFYFKTDKSPTIVLKYVASGAFGPEAMQGGIGMMIWGLVFHYLIALGCVMAFFFLYPNVKIMRANKWITAIVFALLAWVVTTRLIVPLSRIKPAPFNFSNAWKAMAILVLMIGIPITFIVGKYYDNNEKK